MSPIDSVFLTAESREHPMHVAGLQVFEPPAGAGPEFVTDLHQAILGHQDVAPIFRERPTRLLGGFANVGWSYDQPA